MLIELVLTHTCEALIGWSAGAYADRRGRPVTHCPGCGEWLGEPFLRAEEVRRGGHAARAAGPGGHRVRQGRPR